MTTHTFNLTLETDRHDDIIALLNFLHAPKITYPRGVLGVANEQQREWRWSATVNLSSEAATEDALLDRDWSDAWEALPEAPDLVPRVTTEAATEDAYDIDPLSVQCPSCGAEVGVVCHDRYPTLRRPITMPPHLARFRLARRER